MHQAKTRARRGRLALAGALALGLSGGALAQSGAGSQQTVVAPPLLTLTPPGPRPLKEMGVAPPSAVEGPEVQANLDVVYINSRIWNPNSKMFDQVRLRAYQDATRPNDPSRPYVAPTLVAKPGNTVRILMRNLLPPEEGCPGHGSDINIPHCFNTTNLHSHGLWVSPAGISDNVLRTLPPNKDFTYEYEYNIPADHPAGTFWYHPHVHGSTAIQVASGLAGALIVKGERLPQRAVGGGVIPGDVDVLLKSAPDKTFVMQQIQYICRDPKAPPGPSGLRPSKTLGPGGPWICDKGDVGVLDGYDVFGPNWGKSGRFTTVNGATTALLSQDARVGMPERWRFIHGGVADTIRVSIRKRAAGAKAIDLTQIGAAKQDEIIEQQCEPTKDAVPQFEIAADGLTRVRALERTSTFLQPGYRSDVLVAFDEPGEYCVIDETVNVAQAGVQGSSDRRQLLFLVKVDAGKAAPPRDQVVDLLASSAERLAIPDAAFKAAIVKGLRENLDLTAFAPHTTLANAKIDTHQTLFFSLSNAETKPSKGPAVGREVGKMKRFDPNDFSRTLVLGNTDEWELRIDPDDAVKIGHPFHIHVNPFEVMSVTGPGGRDLTADPTSQYFGMKGAFKDTIFIEYEAVVKVRSHYRRYIGDFVLHCHILNHEDGGMMEMVRIADRGADGKPLVLGHGLIDAGEGTPKSGHEGH